MSHFLKQKMEYALQGLLVAALLTILPSTLWASDKKGVGLSVKQYSKNKTEAVNKITALNIAWYYTWSPVAIDGVPEEKFVPMIWGGDFARVNKQAKAVQEKKKPSFMLAINEPNKEKQANMSVAEVVDLWPSISGIADKISTPAAAGGGNSPWIKQFMKIAREKNLKIDFMAIHKYGPPDAKKFLSDIDMIYAQYKMPIWITEFSVADFSASEKNCKTECKNKYSEEEVLEFMKEVLPELEKRAYVVRYAWYGTNSINSEAQRTSSLFDNDGNLTKLGKFYADFQ